MKKKTILIVEDEPIIAADIQDRLMDLDYQVIDVIDNGEEALLKIRQEVPDMILMDVHLAGKLDGVETAIRMRKITDTPLIFLTSNSDEPTFQRAKEARPHAFISKPFRGRDLLHAIALAIGEGSIDSSTHLPSANTLQGNTPQASHDRLFIKVKDRLIRLMLTDILYLEADDYYCKVHTEDHSYLATKTLKKLSEQLPPDGPFFRCHRSYVVNIKRITEISETHVFLGGQKVPLSRSKRPEILVLVNKM
ncbi:LytR/AlgR family response regulator transcription factor [Neolewinella agarilytica]|uniref:Two component transcriptional regulator, LytTR family n=1 Tax=Neolewinella agarilytica TaxID=478744 RepID=A0A1H9NM04_9BACT|nr:LytTR family transcriptional regulator DNA-binding domain-containing protein [Neolewinella agarilytica]SER36922.1 two component transcriptional regulator, LytTR family [Neolewinella agarilytica]